MGLTSCSDDGSGNQNLSPCPEGFRADGPACVPIFDALEDCPGPAEMPALGGGCRPVGVPECSAGFTGDGEGGCEPILPPGPGTCPPGTMEILGQSTCQPVGVLECAAGFVSDGEGGCEAILPPGPNPCPSGSIEQIGHDACQPLTDCGPDPSAGGSAWGLIVTDAATVYVDATADASGAEGTAAAPFPTVGAALAAAAPGGQVAIAAGVYEEVLVIDKPVRLAGRCSALVTLRSPSAMIPPEPALRIASAGTSSTVRGVTLTGPAEGLLVTGARMVLVEEVEILETGGLGVSLASDGDRGSECTLRRVKVSGGTTRGILAEDSALIVEGSVVRDTQPEPGTGAGGRGIQIHCTRSEACGTLRVATSLVTGNWEAGIILFGVRGTVVGSVIRDTRSRQTGQTSGRGITAQCDTDVGTCGSLHVEESLLAGNRDVAISAIGVDATVIASVARDTLGQERDGVGGGGISAECDPDAQACGSLVVEESLVAGNRQIGIFSGGTPTTIRATVVRDTQAQQSDDMSGWGIAAGCYSSMGRCPSLLVERSLVTGNQDLGIFSWGADTSVAASVVRDTRPAGVDLSGGNGIAAQCDQHGETCGSLRVESCLVEGNREMGIFSWGVDTSVAASVVRDTLAQESDGGVGRGISALCLPSLDACGSLQVEGCLVAGNRQVGIHTSGGDATVISTVVRDTLAVEADLSAGRGINAQCDDHVGDCGRLTVQDCLLTGNRDLGIAAIGVDATIASSVVRDTLPRLYDHAFGRGVNAQCDDRAGVGVCGSLTISNTLVERSEDVGIFLYGVAASISGAVIRDTAANAAGPWAGERGQGIWALCSEELGACGSLALGSCLVAASHGAAVALEGVSGTMTGCLVDTVLAQPKDDKYGYGVQIGGRSDAGLPTFDVQSCEIRAPRLVGLLYYRSTGTLSRTLIAGGEYSVAMNEGSSPTIAKDNQLSGTVKSAPQWVSLYPSPAPPPAAPSEGSE